MGATKSNTQVHNSTTLTAGAGDTTSSAVDLTTAYGAVLNIKLTNGATGPTVPAQCQVQVSEDNSKYYNFGFPLVGSAANSAVTSWTVEIPLGVQYIKTVSGSNTGQNVTIDVDCSAVTGI